MQLLSLVGRRPDFYSSIASAAESGWDFSSRWLKSGSSELSSIRTQEILPVDLNAILCQNELTLYRLYSALNNTAKAQFFLQAFQRRQRIFDALFWNESRGMWFDWDLQSNSHLPNFYASSLVPLLWGCSVAPNETKHVALLKALQSLGVLDYPGGIPASLVQGTGQQWDFPNAWAPHQWFPVAAWARSGLRTLRQAARKIAETWIRTVYSAWTHYNHTIFEKVSFIPMAWDNFYCISCAALGLLTYPLQCLVCPRTLVILHFCTHCSVCQRALASTGPRALASAEPRALWSYFISVPTAVSASVEPRALWLYVISTPTAVSAS